MRVILLLLTITLTLPIQANATDLKIFKPKTKSLTMSGAMPSVIFSEFRIQKGNGRTDWFVTIKNISKANMARNTYEVRAAQINKINQKSQAGSFFKLGQDLRPGRIMNLQRQFVPGRDINKISLEVVDLKNNRIIGTRTFIASTAESNPIGTSTTTQIPSQVAVNPDNMALNRYNLQLSLEEEPNGKVKLNVKNIGSGPVNLSRFTFSINGHLLGRPTQTLEITLNETLQPQKTTFGKAFFEYSYCATFTHYSAVVSGMGKQFKTRKDIEAQDILPLGLSFVPYIGTGIIDENSYLEIKLWVSNKSNRPAIQCYLEGMFSIVFQEKKRLITQYYPVDLLVHDIIPGKQHKTVILNLGQTNFDTIRAHASTALWDKEPKAIGIQARLRSDKNCGVTVYYGDIISGTMQLD